MNLLLIGGGHAMLPSLRDAQRWTSNGVQVTLLDSNPFLYYSGMVPEYLGGVYTRDEVRINLDRLCDQAGIHFVDTPAEHLDPERRRVTTADGLTFSYDVAAIDIGAQNPGFIPNAVPTKPLYRVETLEERIQSALNRRDATIRLVIAGGGAAGVEVALNVISRFKRHDRSEALSLTLVEGAPRLLPGFPAIMSAYVTKHLEARGASIVCSTQVDGIRDGAALLNDERRLPTDLVQIGRAHV